MVDKTHNVGDSVGWLYFVNTLRAALGCFYAATWFFAAFGLQHTVYIAAGLDFVAALLVMPFAIDEAFDRSTQRRGDCRHHGLINLSYEMLWVRVYSFAIKGAALAFPLLLSAYLVGLALGSLASTRVSRRLGERDPRALAWVAVFVGVATSSVSPQIAFAGLDLFSSTIHRPWRCCCR
ncbi:MAG: hypothetical protein R3E66_07285 [bacterium]